MVVERIPSSPRARADVGPGTRVDPFDADDAVTLQIGIEIALGAELLGSASFANDEPRHLRMRRLFIFRRDAVNCR